MSAADIYVASFPGLRGGGGEAWYILCTHARNYCAIDVREQWACTQNVEIVPVCLKGSILRSSGKIKKVSPVRGPCAS